jgi:Ni2+-binding GTPase involved in maturation of urease and hydrogenase
MNGEGTVPLLIVTGFLGAGKTSLLQRALHREGSWLAERFSSGAVVVYINDFSDENVDAELLGGASLSSVRPLSGGCVCCNLLPAFLDDLSALVRAKLPVVDYVVLECTGVADPLPVVGAVLVHPYLSQAVRIDAVVAVVDASQFDLDADPLQGAQLCGVNVVVLNKKDLFYRHLPSPRHAGSQCSELEMMEIDVLWRHHRSRIAEAARSSNARVRVYDSACCTFALEELVVRKDLFAAHGSGADALQRFRDLLSQRGAVDGPSEEALELQRLGVRSIKVEIPMTKPPPKLSVILQRVRDGVLADV